VVVRPAGGEDLAVGGLVTERASWVKRMPSVAAIKSWNHESPSSTRPEKPPASVITSPANGMR
jgi:hypothetical protein